MLWFRQTSWTSFRGRGLSRGLGRFSGSLSASFRQMACSESPTAPARIARTWNFSSGKAVTKMTGMRWPSAMSWPCSSRPERPGICKSVIRHDVSARHSASRNRSADPKVATSYPSDSIRSRSDSLTKSSSSTNRDHGSRQFYDPDPLIAEIARRYHCTNVTL